VNILVDEPTRTRTDENFVFRKIDTVRVKGSNTPRTVYELVGLSGESALPVPFEIIDRYEEGLLTYQDGDWKKAETLFHTNAEE
jgi:hypothetical protein